MNPMYILSLLQLILTTSLFWLGIYSKRLIKKVLYSTVGFISWAIVLIQIDSLAIIGKFIPPMAFENIGEGNELGFSIIPPVLIVLVISIIIFFCIRWMISRKSQAINQPIIILILLIITCIPNISPIHSFGKSLASLYEQYKYSLSDVEIQNIKKEISKEYVYKNSLADKYIKYSPNNNIIVIFTEGLSSLVISKELTPNIYYLQKNLLMLKITTIILLPHFVDCVDSSLLHIKERVVIVQIIQV